MCVCVCTCVCYLRAPLCAIKCLSSVLTFFNQCVRCGCMFERFGVLQCSHISVCMLAFVCFCVYVGVCVSLSSSWLARLLVFGHMLSFISLRHQSCWPAVRTAALSVPLLLCFSLLLYHSCRLALALSVSLGLPLTLVFSSTLMFL